MKLDRTDGPKLSIQADRKAWDELRRLLTDAATMLEIHALNTEMPDYHLQLLRDGLLEYAYYCKKVLDEAPGPILKIAKEPRQ